MRYDRHNPPVFNPRILHEDIRTLAYLKWERAGRPKFSWSDKHFWREAYQELYMRAVAEVFSTKPK